MKCINQERINQANNINDSNTDNKLNSDDNIKAGFDSDKESVGEFALYQNKNTSFTGFNSKT